MLRGLGDTQTNTITVQSSSNLTNTLANNPALEYDSDLNSPSLWEQTLAALDPNAAPDLGTGGGYGVASQPVNLSPLVIIGLGVAALFLLER